MHLSVKSRKSQASQAEYLKLKGREVGQIGTHGNVASHKFSYQV